MSVKMYAKIDRAEQKKIERALKQMPFKVFKKHVGRAAGMAMTPVLKDARKRVPVEEGDLKESLAKKRKQYVRRRTCWVGVGPSGKTGQQGWLVEYGHRIVVGGTTARISGRDKGKTPKAANQANTGKGRVVGMVPPKPFLRPAFEANKAKVFSVYRRKLIAGIEKETKAV